MRLRVADGEAARRLATALTDMLDGQPAVVREDEPQTVAVVWGESETEPDDEEWDEQAHADLVFYLRAWSADDPRRELTILDRGLVEISERTLRRAS